ncbi:MAG: DUF11 domain-containing protein [Nitrospirae bacterium]|nr:DUF11 domain-containing protein [Nitrospirota bacterium]
MDISRIKWVLAGVVSFLLAAPGISSAFITTHYSADVAMTSVSFEAEGRIGDLSGTQTYELDLGPSTISPVQTAQYNWPNGTPVPFTLSYDNVSNLITFTVGSNTLTYPPVKMLIDLFIRTRAVNSDTGILVDNLVLNGIPVGDLSNAYVPGTSGIDILQISGASLSNGFTLTGQATMTWVGSPPYWSKLGFLVKVSQGKADLSLIKTDSPDPVNVGQSLTYILNITNNGPTQANNVIVTDTLPAGVTFVSAVPTQGSCSGTGTVTCNLGSIANGANATVTIVVNPTITGTIYNSASVSSAEYDYDKSNNTASKVPTTVNLPPVVPVADLSISKIDSPDPVMVGDSLLYTITVTNNGPDGATGVKVTDTLPVGVSMSSAIPSQGTCSGTDTVTCDLGSLGSGASATVLITVTPSSTGTIYNSATVTGSENDPDISNNTTQPVSTTINSLPSVDADLSITKTDSPDPVPLVGDNLTYTVTVINNGPASATGVLVTDYLPTSIGSLQVVPIELISVTPSQGTCSGTFVLSCDIGTLAGGASATITIVTKTLFTGIISNTATVSGNQNDPDNVNNSAVQNTNIGDVSRLINISTRAFVGTVDDRAIGGFIVGGELPKTIVVRGRGPSMSGPPFNITGTLSNPYLRLYSSSDGAYIAQNDNCGDQSDPLCGDSGYVCGTIAEIKLSNLDPCMPNPGQTSPPPRCTYESCIMITVPPGSYSTVLSGVSNGTGVGLAEVFDIDGGTMPKLVNISTRAQVLTGFNRMIGGFIVGAGSGDKKILIRARGPSMSGAPFNISSTLSNPNIRLYSSGAEAYIAQNDNWGDQSDTLCSGSGFVCGTAADITATGMDPCVPNPGETSAPPGCTDESAILITVPPGAYSAVVSGVNDGTGVGLVEIFDITE